MDTKHKMNADIQYYQRMTKNEVWQHNFMWVSFVVLVITGFMAKLPHEWVNLWFGQHAKTLYEIRAYVHRVFGWVLAFVTVWHVYYIAFTKEGRNTFKALLPVPKDFRDMKDNILFLLGKRDERPKFDRFDYREKMEYIFGALGTVIITITGMILFFSEHFGKLVLDISMVIHRMEAILATMSISIWHLYSVHFKPGKFPFSTIFIDGKMELHELEEEHPLVYEELMKSLQAKTEEGTEG